MVEYHSVHAQFFQEYIDFKRSLGYKYDAEYIFKGFDRFLVEKGVHEIGLTQEICELWAEKRPNEKETNRYRRLNNIRNYSMYLNRIGYTSYVQRQPKRIKTTFTPYIFTKDEISSFFNVCDNLVITNYSRTANIYPALFRLVYGCGLRINEALSLQVKDVNLYEKYIIVRDSKNGEDRILPFTDTVFDALLAYQRRWRAAVEPDELFFTDRLGNTCTSDTAYRYFRKILFQAGISHGGKGIGPRVHDFRYAFSVHSLAAMAEAGLDLYYCLPILSKYLGHKSLEATEGYVRLTEEMYPGIMAEMNRLCSCIFPEVKP